MNLNQCLLSEMYLEICINYKKLPLCIRLSFQLSRHIVYLVYGARENNNRVIFAINEKIYNDRDVNGNNSIEKDYY